MAQTCCINGCNNSDEGVITLFKFPTSRTHRRKWLDAIKDAGKVTDKVVASSVLCSDHFNSNDYEDYRGRIRLKRKVVPTVFEGTPRSPTPPAPDPQPQPPPEPETTEPEDTGHLNGDIQDTPIESLRRPSDVEDHCIEVTPEIDADCTDPPTPEMDHRQDIEDILTNYHIKNTGPGPGRGPSPQPQPQPLTPSYIEISVDKRMNGKERVGSPQDDCVMLLENVQVDIDPSSLMLEEREQTTRKEDHISLLTSSDEDDVIIQEPNIDTVEVSDETDEDDVPLMKLVKDKPGTNPKDSVINKMFWGFCEYYCMHCHYTSSNRYEFKKHKRTHEKVLQVCDLCGYTTASETQFSKHKRKHKDDRTYKCHICDYKAKHNMSLIYHLKSHDGVNLTTCKSGFKCTKCGFKSNLKSAVLKHVRACSKQSKSVASVQSGNHPCNLCQYITKRASDLKRHKRTMHK